MNNYKLKTSLTLLLVCSVLIFFLIGKVQGADLREVTTVLGLVSKVVSVDLLIITGFSLWFWKFPIFKGWLVVFPNLNGTWKGTIHTTWVDPETGNRPAPIPAILTIKQSFFKISCIMRTGEMTSRSLVASFILDDENQLKRLFYSYDSNPKQTVKERSPQHCGTMSFDIIEKPEKKLIGEYWTGRKTTGNIEMTFWIDELIEYYPNEIGEHPVSQIRGNQE